MSPRTLEYVEWARWLSSSQTSLWEDPVSRWVGFHQSCLNSNSLEVAVISRVAAVDTRSTTGQNNRLFSELTGLEANTATARQVREELRKSEAEVTEEEKN